MNIQNNFIFDDIPFTDVDPAKPSPLKYMSYTRQQSAILQDIILNLYSLDKDNKKCFYQIYGPSGTGKSFMLREIERFLKQRNNKVLYYTLDKWTKDKYNKIHKEGYNYIIIDDFDKLKRNDRIQLEEIVNFKVSNVIVSSNRKDIDHVGFSLKNIFRYRISPLSIIETYNYINNSIYIVSALNTVKNKCIFSFLSKFIIYILSIGVLADINKIALYCLNRATQDKNSSIPITLFMKFVKNNVVYLRNTLVLFIKYFFFVFLTVIILLLSREIYLKINRAKFDRIKQEIELQNLKNSL